LIWFDFCVFKGVLRGGKQEPEARIQETELGWRVIV
jgi:hypothetical protein